MHRNLSSGATLGGGFRSGGVYDGKIAGLYDLEETLGRGHFAVVKLARHVFTGEKVAVKVIDKSKLDEVSKAHLFQEVRCMKLVQHPNVVRLYEVIDTATKLYLILELGDGGDLYDYIMRHDAGLSEQLAREYFRQIVRAISYCHQLHVVHRDLKPENVVFFEKLGVVKLTDFGFSNKFYPGQKLETSCGSLAYSAPEILLGDSYDAPAVDVWSLGVILYMLVCGQAPFQEANDSETLTMIMDCKYNIPAHVSKECRDLISKMLVRAPEKRATLADISEHPWLSSNKQENPQYDVLPLVSREQLSEEDHNLIVQKIVNGNIATKEEIQECLDKNEYNHITATYYLLAERKLRSKRQEHQNKNKRPEHLAVPQINVQPARDAPGQTPCLLSVPRTPGDIPQRSRKCSIVQEDEEEEDMPGCAGRVDLAPPLHCSLNRRGSRSEGRLNLALQERLAESERRKPPPVSAEVSNQQQPPLLAVSKMQSAGGMITKEPRPKSVQEVLHNNSTNNLSGDTKFKPPGRSSGSVLKPVDVKIHGDVKMSIPNVVTTTILTDSSTISLPVLQPTAAVTSGCPDHSDWGKFKTAPSPVRPCASTQLKEIFEEGNNGGADAVAAKSSRQFVARSNQNRMLYEQQRRSKFHKNRTASCSSSDASDDDSENRKKRANKLDAAGASAKPFSNRRDSHDDSSDSQEPGAGTGGGRLNSSAIYAASGGEHGSRKTTSNGASGSAGTSGGGGGKNCVGSSLTTTGRKHKLSRRRGVETRLRESQSLNRITEVQEDGGAHTLVISTTLVAGTVVPKMRGLGSKLFQSFAAVSAKKAFGSEEKIEEKPHHHQSRRERNAKAAAGDPDSAAKHKKSRLLGKYFHVRKKLCIPLPGFFTGSSISKTNNRLYKTQSCGSLCALKQVEGPDAARRNSSAARDSGFATVVQLNNVCNELTGICAVHLGQASRCCSSFC